MLTVIFNDCDLIYTHNTTKYKPDLFYYKCVEELTYGLFLNSSATVVFGP